jgi:hypothetical protein
MHFLMGSMLQALNTRLYALAMGSFAVFDDLMSRGNAGHCRSP